jgi:hypothetical protein
VTIKQFTTVVDFDLESSESHPTNLVKCSHTNDFCTLVFGFGERASIELGFWVPTFLVGPLPTHSTFSVLMGGIVLFKRLGPGIGEAKSTSNGTNIIYN